MRRNVFHSSSGLEGLGNEIPNITSATGAARCSDARKVTPSRFVNMSTDDGGL
jgi:hypothetical protein